MKSMTDVEPHGRRHIVTRTVLAIQWMIPVYFVVVAIVGAVVGVLSSSPDSNAQDAFAAAEAASAMSFEHYGLIIIFAVMVLVATLSWHGMLPGTGKYKGVSYGNRWESLPPVLRSILSVLIVAVVGVLWGIFTVFAGAPGIVSTVGLVVIVAGIGVSLHSSSK